MSTLDTVTDVGTTLSDGDELTVDELAARTGLTVRTVRFYATQGLLPPPERRGRLAYYNSQHRMRLELIRTLQDHGYTLAAIERVLARIPADAAAAEFAVQSAVLAPWLPDQNELIDRAGLERRMGRSLDDEEIDYLVDTGGVTRVGAEFRTSAAALGHACALLELGVPTALLQESSRLIQEHAAAVADGLTETFIANVWAPYQRGELSHEQVLAMMARLRPLAVHGLVSAFGHAADRAARRGLDQA